MKEKLKKTLCELRYQPESDLAERIWHNLLLRNKRIANFSLVLFSILGFASLVGLVPAVKMLASDFTQSGFYEYLSLVFSDRGSILSHFQEFVLSLAEALPTLSILLSLSLVFIFFLSARYAVKHITRGHLSLSLKI